jgi:ferrous iron transport protein A
LPTREELMSIPLTKTKAGKTVRIVSFSESHGMQARLERMGIRIGVIVHIVHTPLVRGPVVVSISRARIAVGHGMATRILVEVVR